MLQIYLFLQTLRKIIVRPINRVYNLTIHIEGMDYQQARDRRVVNLRRACATRKRDN